MLYDINLPSYKINIIAENVTVIKSYFFYRIIYNNDILPNILTVHLLFHISAIYIKITVHAFRYHKPRHIYRTDTMIKFIFSRFILIIDIS